MSDLERPADIMRRLGLSRKSVTLTVTVDLDPVPGWGNDAEDFRKHIQRSLDDSIGHYFPVVSVNEVQA